MATLIISNSASSTLAPTHNHKSPPPRTLFNSPHLANSRSLRFSVELGRRRRALSLVTRAVPSTNSFVFAFVLPLSLLAITIFTSIRIGDRLDKKFLEEIAINQELLEADEEDGDVDLYLDKEPALPHTRNRPKREA